MSAKHTPGPWRLDDINDCACIDETYHSIAGGVGFFMTEGAHANTGFGLTGHLSDADARLIVAAPALLEALRESIDLAWIEDSHVVEFDGTVLFGLGYDFSGLDGHRRQEFHGQVECIVWPSGGLSSAGWSAYCTHDGSLWFEKFASAGEAKEACMRMLDKLIPNHPAMKARAAIAAATEEQP